jgi:hypothetical protein
MVLLLISLFLSLTLPYSKLISYQWVSTDSYKKQLVLKKGYPWAHKDWLALKKRALAAASEKIAY